MIFDLLTKPEITLTKAEEREVKKVAKQLLETLKREKLVLDWKKRQTTRAAVRYTIETVLDELPRTYTPELYQQKCERGLPARLRFVFRTGEQPVHRELDHWVEFGTPQESPLLG